MAETDGVELSVLPLFSPSLDPSLLLPFLRIDTSLPSYTEPAPSVSAGKGTTLLTKYLRKDTNKKMEGNKQSAISFRFDAIHNFHICVLFFWHV